MPRNLSTSVKTALSAASVEFYYLVKIRFSTPVYYTTAPYDIEYNGDVYLSNAILSKIPDVKETLKISPSTFNLKLGGSQIATQALALTEGNNAEVYIYRYFPAIDEAVLINHGFTDGFKSVEDTERGTSTIDFNVANHWSNWEQSNDWLLTDDYQQSLFPGDKGLEYVGKTDFISRLWGKENTSDLIYDGNYFVFRGLNLPNTDPFNLAMNEYSGLIAELKRGGLTEADFIEQQKNKTQGGIVPIVYGKNRIKGIPVFRGLEGANSKYLHIVYVLSAGECESLNAVYLENDKDALTDSTYTPLVTVDFKTGVDAKGLHTALNSALPSLWTADHLCKGITTVHIRYEYDKDVFSGEPQPVFEIKGKKLYDPRTGTTSYSTQPALVLYDYLTSTRYGKGLQASELGGISNAADYGEVLKTDHDGSFGGTPTTITRHDFSCVIAGGAIKKNAEKILNAMLGHIPWVGGVYQLVLERDDSTSVYSFSEDNVKSGVAVSRLGSKSSFNSVFCKFKNSANGFVDDVAQQVSSVYLTEDNNKPSRLNVELKGETNKYRALNRASTLLKRSRQTLRIEIKAANAGALEITAGDVIDMTYKSRGWTNKLFLVTSLTILASGGLIVGCSEYEASAYDWAVNVESPLPADTTLPNPFSVVNPTGLTLTDDQVTTDDGTTIDRIKISFTASTDNYVTAYQVQWKESTDTVYKSLPDLTSAETVAYLNGVKKDVQYDIRVRSVNALGRPALTWVNGSKTFSIINVIGYFNELIGSFGYNKTNSEFIYDTWQDLSYFSLGSPTSYGNVLNINDSGSGTLYEKPFDTTGGILDFNNVVRAKTIASINNASEMTSGLLYSSNSDGKYTIGFRFLWNSSTSKIDVYSHISDLTTTYEVLMDSVNNNEDIEIEYVLDGNGNAEFYLTTPNGNFSRTSSAYLGSGVSETIRYPVKLSFTYNIGTGFSAKILPYIFVAKR